MIDTPLHERLMNVEFTNATARVALKLNVFDSAKLQASRELRRAGAPREGLEALKSDPYWSESAEALSDGALCHAALCEYDEAAALLEQCEQRLNIQMATLYTNKAMVAYFKEDLVAVETFARQAIRYRPGDYVNWVNLLAAYQDRPEQLEAVMSELERLWPGWRGDADFRRHVDEDVTLAHVRAYPQITTLFDTKAGNV